MGGICTFGYELFCHVEARLSRGAKAKHLMIQTNECTSAKYSEWSKAWSEWSNWSKVGINTANVPIVVAELDGFTLYTTRLLEAAAVKFDEIENVTSKVTVNFSCKIMSDT